MLAALRLSKAVIPARPAAIVAARSLRAYHSFHEDKANVLPNLIEPQSASFKVRNQQLEANVFRSQKSNVSPCYDNFRRTRREWMRLCAN